MVNTLMETKNVSIIGGASISAAFIMKFIARHNSACLKHVYSVSQAGKKVSSYHTFLTGMVDNVYEAPDAKKLLEDSDIIFITRQHGEFIHETAHLVSESLRMNKEVRFIDLSADFRLKDPSNYTKWYGIKHNHKELLAKAVYGLPELKRSEIKNASFVANPGCYATCAILSLAPFIKEGASYDSIVVNALSGVSGAGMRPSKKNIAMNVSENIFAYKAGGVHPHTIEIEQGLSGLSPKPDSVLLTFVPHVAPFKYGILQTIYVKLNQKMKEGAIFKHYSEFYKYCKFVNVIAPPNIPQIKDVAGANFVNIGIKIDKRTNTLIIISCIDNIIKGAAGQAVQNMNLMCGFDEAEGLV